ncbi:hypothetical protein BAUCODRAFT_79877 [Baudoinia panamericana UAMH 10762]|uniref:Dienelactone hydrolase domain-containing protein n=1 Tax=Baudoinia panamericana (strain UAMH 10762) TaxID=717646 RepID=M2MWV3_BAUPA|nr:uncharacterized protein BAUCODRAFT_79877 [Baudoinia panamericana UAMH 10762]EMC91099.1 hypothetical protein BAUCODRAFT_79877 [Baudoinia panamericana UAMH 10762]
MQSCCFRGFQWNGTPKGKTEPFPTSTNQAYVTGVNKDTAIMLVHDAFGWSFGNNRLLADHLAEEVNATVYLPDLFGGEVLPSDSLSDRSRWGDFDMDGFQKRNSRAIREPELFECAKHLRSQYKKVGAIGYCYGGWAVFRLAAKGHNLVDCVVAGHPSWVTRNDIDGVDVPTQILAPEIDHAYTDELKEHTWETLQKHSVPFDYQHFPGVEHACLVRGDPKRPGERDAMIRGKNAAVGWFKQYLHRY